MDGHRTTMVDELAMEKEKFVGPRASVVAATIRRRTDRLWRRMEVATCPGVEPAIGFAEGASTRRIRTGKERRRWRNQSQTR